MTLVIRQVAAGVAAGVALAAGGVAAVQLGSESAEAQSSGSIGAQVNAANERSQAAIRLAKNLQNNVGKYFQPRGQLIGGKPPPGPIRQQRGTGDRGLPTSTIKNRAITRSKIRNSAVNASRLASGAVTAPKIRTGAVTGGKLGGGSVTASKLGAGAVTEAKLAGGSITEAKLAAALQAKLPRWVTKVDNGANENGRASSTEFSVVRVGVGDYRADFGDTIISQCSWNAVPSADSGLPTGFEIQTALDTTDTTRLLVMTYTSTGVAADSGWQAQVFC